MSNCTESKIETLAKASGIPEQQVRFIYNLAIEEAAETTAETAASLAGHIMFTEAEKVPLVQAAVTALSDMVDGIRELKEE